MIDKAFPALPAAFGNDVKLAALAELTWGALAKVAHGVYLNLGTGIAATLVVDGQVVDGAHGAAGEIGYWLTGSAMPQAAAQGAAPTEEALGGRVSPTGPPQSSGGRSSCGTPQSCADDRRAEALLQHL